MSTTEIRSSPGIFEKTFPTTKKQFALTAVAMVGLAIIALGVVALLAYSHILPKELSCFNVLSHLKLEGIWTFIASGLIMVAVSSCLYGYNKKAMLSHTPKPISCSTIRPKPETNNSKLQLISENVSELENLNNNPNWSVYSFNDDSKKLELLENNFQFQKNINVQNPIITLTQLTETIVTIKFDCKILNVGFFFSNGSYALGGSYENESGESEFFFYSNPMSEGIKKLKNAGKIDDLKVHISETYVTLISPRILS